MFYDFDAYFDNLTNTSKKYSSDIYYPSSGVLAGNRTGSKVIGKDQMGFIYADPTTSSGAASGIMTNPSTGYGGYGGSGGGVYDNYPTIPMPDLELAKTVYPTYTAPARDEKREEFLQQKAAAPGISNLRQGLQAGITSTRSEDNPYLRKYYLGGMLQNFGQGLGDIKTKGDIIGSREYETEYGTKADEAKTQFATSTQQAISDAAIANQAALAKYNLLASIYAQQPLSKKAKSVYASGTTSPYNYVGNKVAPYNYVG